MTLSGLIPVNLKKFNNDVIAQAVTYLNDNNKNFQVTLMSGPIEGNPQIGFETALDFKIQFLQDKEYTAYANICLNVGEYHEEDYKTGGRNDNTREFNEILKEVNVDAVLTISLSPIDDIYYLLYLNFFQAMLITLKSVGKSVEYFYRDDYGMKDFKYNNVEYLDKLKGMYINSRKKNFKELSPKKQARAEIFQCEYTTYDNLLTEYYHCDRHTSTWTKEEDITSKSQEMTEKLNLKSLISYFIILFIIVIILILVIAQITK